jgi:hypothetical protein
MQRCKQNLLACAFHLDVFKDYEINSQRKTPSTLEVY